MAITPLPTPPTRTDRANFRSRADAFLAALPDFGTEANALATEVEGYKDDAETAQIAAEAAGASAVAAANFEGNWSDLTGALNVPASVLHSGQFWMLLDNLLDVTASEPDESNTDWQVLLPFASEAQAAAGTSTTTVMSPATTAAMMTGRRNLIINGGFFINQRIYVSGTNTTSANEYTLDRWRVVTSGQNLTFADSNGTRTVTAPAGGIEQVIEGTWVQSGDYVISWTGTATCTVNSTARTSGETFALTGGSNITVKFSGGTVSNVQLEAGEFATDFEMRDVGTELALCQRYYQVVSAAWSGDTTSGGIYQDVVSLSPNMRTAPSCVGAINANANGFPVASVGDFYFSNLFSVRFIRQAETTNLDRFWRGIYSLDAEL
jgi:hypothetical protein